MQLLGGKWQPLSELTDLQLHVQLRQQQQQAPGQPQPPPPLPPPAALSHRVSHLHLHRLALSHAALAAWRLHDPALWPHLQHLAVDTCAFAGGASRTALPPVPRLRSFTWSSTEKQEDLEPICCTLLPLASNATHLRLDINTQIKHEAAVYAGALRTMRRATHVHLTKGYLEDETAAALLAHPALQHVHLDLDAMLLMNDHRGRRPAPRWKTLTVDRLSVCHHLGMLPMEGLERLIVHGHVDAAHVLTGLQEEAVDLYRHQGLEALRQLHARGALDVRPLPPGSDDARMWRLEDGDKGVALRCGLKLSSLLPMVLAAAPDVCTVILLDLPPLELLRAVVAPLLQRTGRVSKLCMFGAGQLPAPWWSGLLGALPPCVARVTLRVLGSTPEACLKDLVRGGAGALRHVGRLMLHMEEALGEKLEGKLNRLAWQASGGGGEGGHGRGRQRRMPEQQPQLLTVEVVRVT